MLGARTDVNRILADSDLVVGVSRVAMEAMSCARPVILAGPQGFGGLLEPDRVGRFKEDNFTARQQNAAVTVPRLVDRPGGVLRQTSRVAPEHRAVPAPVGDRRVQQPADGGTGGRGL